MSEVVEHHKHNNQYNHVDLEDNSHQVIHNQEHHQHLKMDIPSITTENNDEAEMKDEAELNKISAELVDQILQPQLNGHHESSVQEIKTESTHKSEVVVESESSLPQTPPTPPPTHESFHVEINQVDSTVDNDAESSISPSSVDFVKMDEMTSASSPEKLDLASESPDQVPEQSNSGHSEVFVAEQSHHVEESVEESVESQEDKEPEHTKGIEEPVENQASEETVHSQVEEPVEKPAESQVSEEPVHTQVNEEPEVVEKPVETQVVEEHIVVEEHPVQDSQPEVKAVEQEQPVSEPEVVEQHVEEETAAVVEPVPTAEMNNQVPEKTAEAEVVEPHVEEFAAADVEHQEIVAPVEAENHEEVPKTIEEPEVIKHVEVQQLKQSPVVDEPVVNEPAVEEPVVEQPDHKQSIESMHAEPLVKDEPEPLKEELLNPHVVEQVKEPEPEHTEPPPVPEVNPLPVDLADEMSHVKITAQPTESQNPPISEPAIVVSVPVEDAKNDQQEPILLVVEDTTKFTEVIPPEQMAPAFAQIQEQVNTAPPAESSTPQAEVAQSTSALEENAQNTSGSSKNSTLPRRYLDAARKRCAIL